MDRLLSHDELLKLAEEGDAEAQHDIGMELVRRDGIESISDETIEWFRRSAESGYAESQFFMGMIYFHGFGVEKSYRNAIEWYAMAAKQDHAAALYEIAVMYYHGYGLVQSYRKAAGYLVASAEKDYDPAMFELGSMYEQGKGVEKSYREALRWYRMGAERGNFNAQYQMGKFCLRGLTVERSTKEAAKWFRPSAEQGYVHSQHALAELYLSGDGVEQSYEEAFRWFYAAAKGGHVPSMLRLARLYMDGTYVEQSYGDAAIWYSFAAEEDDPDALYRLAELYEEGKGVEQSFEKAAELYKRSSAVLTHMIHDLRDEDTVSGDIYVIDTETTGTDGYPNDLIVDIAVFRVNPGMHETEKVFSTPVGYDVSKWNWQKKNSWIFSNSSLRIEDIAEADPAEQIAKVLGEFLRDKIVTSYGTKFDFNKFLKHDPWNVFDRDVYLATDIMEAAKPYCRDEMGCKDYYSWPRLDDVYRHMYPDDKEKLLGNDRRAENDARMSAMVLLRLYDLGYYRV